MEYIGSIIDRNSLKSYILRQLGGCYEGGEGSHDVEITEGQLEDIIDDTMVELLEQVYDGHEKVFVELPITKGIIKYTLPSDILQVLKIHQAIITSSVFRQAFIGSMTDSFFAGASAGTYSYLDYQILNFHLNQIESMTTVPINFNFNGRTKTLIVFDTNNLQKVLLECYRYTGDNELDQDNLYGHQYIKKMCVARAYKQWYRNLCKYDAPVFDGNVKLNLEGIKEIGDVMYEEAIQELNDKWSDCFGSVYVP